MHRQRCIRDGVYFEDGPSHPYAYASPKANYSRPFTGRIMDPDCYNQSNDRPEMYGSEQPTAAIPEAIPRIVYEERLYFIPESSPSGCSSSSSVEPCIMSSEFATLAPSYRHPEDLLEPPARSYSSLASAAGGNVESRAHYHAPLYAGDQVRADSRLGIHRPRAVSLAPSELPTLSGRQQLSNQQIAELKRISLHEKSRISSLDAQKFTVTVDEPPNGGFLAWLEVLGSFFCIFNAQGLNMSFGVFQAFYELTFLPNCSPSKIAWIGLELLWTMTSLCG
jgi:hypothetical protein